ncbi:MAG: hypothetical protein WBM28_11585, partial [Burkholderiales bacterium]
MMTNNGFSPGQAKNPDTLACDRSFGKAKLFNKKSSPTQICLQICSGNRWHDEAPETGRKFYPQLLWIRLCVF